MRGGCSGRDAIIGLIDQEPWRRPRPRRSSCSTMSASAACYGTTSKDNKKPPIGLDGLARIVERCSVRARRNFRSAPSPASMPAMRRDVIAAGADGVAVISALSLATDPARPPRRELRAIVDDGARRARRAHDRDRRHHRGFGFRRRRRHPGRPEDLLRARRLWRVGHHRADRAEHQGRHRHPRCAAGFHHGADRRGVLRSRLSMR